MVLLLLHKFENAWLIETQLFILWLVKSWIIRHFYRFLISIFSRRTLYFQNLLFCFIWHFFPLTLMNVMSGCFAVTKTSLDLQSFVPRPLYQKNEDNLGIGRYVQVCGIIKNNAWCKMLETGPDKVSQPGMYLPHNSEDPNSIPSTREKSQLWWSVYNPRAGEMESGGFLSLASQLAQPNQQAQDSERDPASKKKKTGGHLLRNDMRVDVCLPQTQVHMCVLPKTFGK